MKRDAGKGGGGVTSRFSPKKSGVRCAHLGGPAEPRSAGGMKHASRNACHAFMLAGDRSDACLRRAFGRQAP
jgi:hypothetical protein